MRRHKVGIVFGLLFTCTWLFAAGIWNLNDAEIKGHWIFNASQIFNRAVTFNDTVTVTGAVTFSGDLVVGDDLTVTGGDITGANGNAIDIGEAVDGTITFSRDDAGTVTLTSADNNANADLTVAAGGSGALTLGDVGSTCVITTSDWGIDATGIVTGLGTIGCGAITSTSTIGGTDITGSGAVQGASLVSTGGNLTGSSGTVTLKRSDAGTLTLTSADDNADADLTVAAGGSGALLIGDLAATTEISSSSWGISTAGAVTGLSSITRSMMTEEALAAYGIVPLSWGNHNGAPLSNSETGGTFNVNFNTNVYIVQGEVSEAETEVSVGVIQFVLPPEYVAAGDVKIRLKSELARTGGGATNNGSTLDIEVYEQSGNGAVGGDLCTTAAATYVTADTWYTSDFEVTATGLAAGDIIIIKVTASVVESEAEAGSLTMQLDGVAVLLDIKG